MPLCHANAPANSIKPNPSGSFWQIITSLSFLLFKFQTPQAKITKNCLLLLAPPVVGWPPVGAFRKNLAPQPKMEPKVPAATTSAAEAPKAAEESMYVKVNIEGYAVGRKINLKAHDSYDSLSRALLKMFNNFFSIDYFKNQEQSDEDEIVNPDYVLIYEDNEGDRMLVGDVPWEMFINSVKRLYIISGATAPSVVAGRMAAKDQH